MAVSAIMAAGAFQTFEAVGPEAVESNGRMFTEEEWFHFLPAETPRMRVKVAELSRVRLCQVRSTGHVIHLREENDLSVLMPRKGALSVQTDAGNFSVLPGDTLIFGPNRRTTTVLPDSSGLFDCDCVLLPLPSASSQHLAKIELAFSSAYPDRRDLALRSCLQSLYKAAAGGSSVFRSAEAGKAAEVLVSEMMYDLVTWVGRAEREDCGAKPADQVLVRKAEEIMHTRLAEPLSVGELAASLNVSARRLQMAFRNVKDTTPLTVLNRLRLDEAHQRLKRPTQHSTVGSIAYSCGFGHLGRFSASYRARHGVAPSVTLMSGRG